MFIQIIKGKVKDADTFRRESERWPRELKPGATGYLGCTWGVASDGTGVVAARFESEDAARANSERPEQGEWWAKMEPAFDEVSFAESGDVDTLMDGGSDAAGFVQLIQGRVKDMRTARSLLQEMQGQLSERRPDILGGSWAWHGDDGTFTQVMYFRSAEDAHAAEQPSNDEELYNRYRDLMASEPTFIDLTEPHFD